MHTGVSVQTLHVEGKERKALSIPFHHSLLSSSEVDSSSVSARLAFTRPQPSFCLHLSILGLKKHSGPGLAFNWVLETLILKAGQ